MQRILISVLKNLLSKLTYFLNSLLNQNSFQINFIQANGGDQFSKKTFTKDDGTLLRLLPNYRWSLKKGWMNFEGLAAASHLASKKILNNQQQDFFQRSVDEFTITKSEDEITLFAKDELIKNYPNFFIFDSKDNYYIKPDLTEINKKISHFVSLYKTILYQTTLKLPNDESPKLLEIGYESGGYEIYAFEKLGFDAFGIDNGYSGLKEPFFFANHISKLVGSKADLGIGDITKETFYDKNFFDVISSEAVLEHILDLPAAFKEMHRILKPGGLLLHAYDPYFHVAGGHALGILDLPWLHLELTADEYLRYIDEIRPFESSRAKEWFLQGLNKSFPQSEMIKCLQVNNFEIIFWSSNKYFGNDNLSPSHNTFFNAQRNYGPFNIDELFVNRHTFIARKKENYE